MRLVVVAAACLIVGTILGASTAWQESAQDPGLQRFDSGGGGGIQSGPRIVIEGGETFDFGSMEYPYEKPGEHEFVIRNDGDAPLTLIPGEPTCRCTISEIRDKTVPPGGQTVIKLTWKPKPVDEQFTNGVDVRTNDPIQPSIRFRAVGKIVRALRWLPDEMTMANVTASEGGKGTIRIYAFMTDDLKIEKLEFTKPETASLFSVETRPIATEDLAEKNAKVGVELIVVANHGLPLGAFEQELQVTTNIPKSEPIAIPIRGRVISDISLIGPKVASDHNLINFDTLPPGAGAKVNAFLLVKGAHRDDVQFKIKSIDPPGVLKAALQPAAGQGGQVVRHGLTVEIDRGAPSMIRLGTEVAPYGTIVLETTHPDVPELVIKVRFAIE